MKIGEYLLQSNLEITAGSPINKISPWKPDRVVYPALNSFLIWAKKYRGLVLIRTNKFIIIKP